MEGIAIAALGVALCVVLCGVGSAIGLLFTGRSAAGVLTVNPKKFGSVIALSLLPATQGIYGFVIGIIGMGSLEAVTTVTQGWQIFAACLPLMITGLTSAILQGMTSVSGLTALAKKDISVGKLILFPAMVETYAILGFVVSIMMLGSL